MHEPVSIPIRDLAAEPEAAGSAGAARSVTDEVARCIVEAITLGASATLSLLDEVHDDELRDLAAAGAGFLIEGMRAIGGVLGAVERSMATPAAAATRSPILGDLLAHWEATWERADADRPTLDETLRRAIDAALDRIDLNEIIQTHVDVQRIARDIDLNELVGDLDVQALADRIDIGALAARIDIDAMVRRLDLDAVVARIDILAIATEVIDELDLAQLIREATADTASDGVRTVRLRGVDADRAVRRAVDRILARHDGSDVS
jgi:hypothetical protein